MVDVLSDGYGFVFGQSIQELKLEIVLSMSNFFLNMYITGWGEGWIPQLGLCMKDEFVNI